MADIPSVPGLSRRTVLAGIGAASAGFLMPEVLAGAVAQSRRQALYAQMLDDAIASRSMKAAIDKSGKVLNPEEQRILLSITVTELDVLGSFRRKLYRTGALVPH
jgi:hypothetical protein